MSKRRLIWLLIAGVVLAGVIVVLWNREPPEPEYGGKKLSEWVERTSWAYRRGWFVSAPGLTFQELEYAVKPDDSAYVIRRIGTNALPFLLQWIQYEPPSWKAKALAAINRGFRASVIDHRARLADGAVRAFSILGSDGGAAIPLLASLMNDNRHPTTADRATSALSAMGLRTLRADMALLTNNSALIRFDAIEMVDHLRGMNGFTPTCLLSLLTDPNLKIRIRATNVVREIDPKLLNKGAEQ